MNVENTDRYHRQSIIPNWDQSKLKEAKVLILGVGATGSYLSTNLVLSGVGTIILVDFDTIEESNLNRQLLFQSKDIGQNKAIVAKERLQLLNPDIDIVAFPNAMEKLPSQLIKDCTVIACCLDTFLGRRWANSLSLRENVPMVSGGMYAFLGDVQTIIPYDTACFECQPLISQEKLSQACTPLGVTRKEFEEKKPEPKLPSVSTLSSIISGLMSQEIIKLILGIGNIIKNYLFYDGLFNSFTEIDLKRNQNCPICGDNYRLKKTEVLVFEGETVKEFLERLAFAFGMADPEVMSKGKFLSKNDKISLKEGDIVYVRDERLALPIALKVKYSE